MDLRQKPDHSESDEKAGTKANLARLLQFVSREESEPESPPTIDAQILNEVATLYERLGRAIAGNALDRAFELAWEIEQRLPGYRDVHDILQGLTAKRVEALKSRALEAAERGEGDRALELVQQIRAIDPHYQFCSRQTIDQILKRVPKIRKRIVMGLKVAATVLVLLAVGFGLVRLRGFLLESEPKSTPAAVADSSPAVTVTARSSPTAAASAAVTAPPNPTPVPASPTPRPSSTRPATATATPRPSVTPTPAVAAIVGAEGAPLRPGATTWWYPRQTLPAGAELEMIGYDPDFPEWVYVRQVDEGVEGWVQLEDLEVHRELAGLPQVTPRPTLTPTAAAPQPAVSDCQEGPLTLDAWAIDYECFTDGWDAIISVNGHGGDCVYVYGWEDEVKAGPMSGPTTYRVRAPHTATLVGEAWVTSAGQRAGHTLFVTPPPCQP